MNYSYIILLLFFICGIFYIARYFYNKFIENKKKDFIENNEFKFNENNKKQDIIYLFYVDWCPHSKEALDEWEKIKKDKIIEDYFNLHKVDCDKKTNKKLIDEFNIKEFPTIILFKNNKKYIFDAKLTKETLMRFLKTVYK